MAKKPELVASDGITPLRRPTAKQLKKRVVTKGGGRELWQASVGSVTPSRLSQILRRHAAGDLDDFLTFAEEMEEKSQHYGSVLGTRKRKLEGLEFSIVAASDEKADQEIAQACSDIIRGDGFIELVQDLLDALGKGFAVVNQIWDTEGANSATPWVPVAWERQDPRLFQLDPSGRGLRIKDRNTRDGLPLEPFKYITHFSKLKSGAPHRAALARACAWPYMFENFTAKDWVGFVETYGQPFRVGKYGPNASDEDVATLVRALQNLGTDAAAAIPQSMLIEFVSAAGNSSGDVFKDLAKYCQHLISKSVLGQTMTTDDGSSNAQSNTHNEVRHDITRSDARRICSTIMRFVLKPFIDLNFGRQVRYPLMVSPVLSPEDLKVLIGVVKGLVELGLPVSENWAYLRFGIQRPANGDKLLVPAVQPNASPAKASRSIAMAAANGSPDAEEIIDDIVDGSLDGWEKVSDGLLTGSLDAIDEAETYEDAILALASRYPDADPSALATTLRSAQAAARGAGDATD